MNSGQDLSKQNKKILYQMVEDYKKIEEVEAIVLGGSSTTNNEDVNSDYDIYIYCTKEPDIARRRKIALKYSENPEIDNHYFETGDVFYLRETSKPIDIMYRTLEWTRKNIENVWGRGNASLGYTTRIADNINKSEILFDREGKFKEIQDLTQTLYPDSLAENIIKKNFSFLKNVMFSYYDQLKSAIERKDYVSVNHRTSAFIASYFDVIFAKNRLLNPGEKKLVRFALENCQILPENFEIDVNNLAVGPVETRLAIAEKMVENLGKIIK